MAITAKLDDGSMFEFDPLDNSIRRVITNWTDVDEEITRKEFGNNLLKMIPFSGMNSKDLAAEVGISTVMMSKYIHGKSTPNVLVARKLARALGCTVDELFDDTYTR
jgi:ribosome-binding protein aMBF1 (putative translation factor)